MNWFVRNTGDFNGDGKSDLLFARDTAEGFEYAVWLMDGVNPKAQASIGTTNWGFAKVGDFNGDGKSDLLFERRVADGWEYGIWLMDGTTLIAQASIGSTAGGWGLVDTGDFNGNGTDDLLFSRPTANGVEFGIWLMDGVRPLAQASIGTLVGNWSRSGVGDFYGNGRDDLLFSQYTPDGIEYSLWQMDGVTPLAKTTLGPTPWFVSVVGDFNGDGKADLMLRQFSNTIGTFDHLLVLMDGAIDTDELRLGPLKYTPQVGDFNGDGKSDLLFARDTINGIEYVVEPMDGFTPLGGASLGVVSSRWSLPRFIVDFNGDGKDDILFVDSANSLIAIWLMDGTRPLVQRAISHR